MTVEPDWSALASREIAPSYFRDLRRQLLVNSSQVEELRTVLRLQKSRLALLSLLILLLILGLPLGLYFGWRDQDLAAAGIANATVVFALFAICKVVPFWRALFGVVWKTECLIAMQDQAIHLAERELEGGGVAAQ